MKRIISSIITFAVFACALLSVAVSADGAIVWTDDFSSKDPANWLWDPPANLFDVVNGKVEGWSECVVLQSNYPSDQGGTRRFKECAWKVDACALEDGGNDSDHHYLGIWFADYLSPSGSEDPEGQIVYEWGFDFEKSQLQLTANFDGAAADLEPKTGYTRGDPVAVVPVPASEAPVMDPTGASVFSIGMRVKGGVLSLYMNDKKYLDFNAYRGATTATQLGSPVLLVNHNCHCTFDNVVVSTADYDLFNDSVGAQPAADAGKAGDPQPYETVIVTDTDDKGNVVTRVETRPAANSGGAATGGNAAKTGDAAIIAVAVMIVALGSAAVVKKTGERR